MNTELLKLKAASLNTTLPIEYYYDDRLLVGTRCTTYQKLKFSEWGLENGYEMSILALCADFDDDLAPPNGSTVEVGGVTKRVLNHEIDAAGVHVRLDLGPEFPA